MPGTLYVVATPIGNLEDITHRALRVLREVDIIACEDTRHTRKLLSHYGITRKTISYHDHNERERAVELLRALESGANVAIVSDAGTPSISDPGFRLVSEAGAQNIPVVALPGPTALIAALVASGLPTDEFFFAGFLPARTGERRARLTKLRELPASLIFYEAPHERSAVVARELTKIHEEIVRGRLSELAERFGSEEKARGEIVLLIDRTPIESELKAAGGVHNIAALVDAFESEGMDHRAALKRAARELGLSRAEAYRRLVAERGK